MLKLFSNSQIREADRATIKEQQISSLDLMERAAEQLFHWIKNHLKEKKSAPTISIFCGMGNNGGDGLALARKLYADDFTVEVFVLQLGSDGSGDFKANLERLPLEVSYLNETSHGFNLKQDSLIVDAIFGTGLNRKIEGFAKTVVKELNSYNNTKLAIDIPSGLFVEDNSGNELDAVFHADHTLSFQFPKLSFLFPSHASLVGVVELLNIDLSSKYIEETPSSYFYLQAMDAASLIKDRKSVGHKGDFGRALLLAGSKGKLGAVQLVAKACLRSGVGLLTVQVPSIGESVLQSTVPEAMVIADKEEDVLSSLNTNSTFDAVGIGPGIGTSDLTAQLLKMLIQNARQPLMIDADGLNLLAENKTWMSYLPANSILTPHPGEFKRLVGDWDSDFERLQLQVDFSKKYGCILVLRGKNSSISTPFGKVFFNSTGNVGMATGGTGDVLTGMITSFLAQSYDPLESALLAVYLHGLAGDIAADRFGYESMLPSDLIECISDGFFHLKSLKQ